MFGTTRMSSTERAVRTANQMAAHVGLLLADARRQRRWTLRTLAERAGIAPSTLHAIEHGRPASLETYAATAAALKLDLRLDLLDPRTRRGGARTQDSVHALMGDVIARRMSTFSFGLGLDEPFQHYQFAGRADVVAWDLRRRALLHVENRTRFPNLQEAIGAYNTKRRYLGPVLAERLGLRGGFASETHVVIGLWSAEVIHVVRLRAASFRATFPDRQDEFDAWWSGMTPAAGRSSAFVLMDPAAAGRQRMFVGLEQVLAPTLRPRYRGYADAASSLEAEGHR